MRRIKVRVFEPGNKRHHDEVYKVAPGKMFTERGVDLVLAQVAEELERRMPLEEYRLVPIAGGQFNFIHDHTKSQSVLGTDDYPGME